MTDKINVAELGNSSQNICIEERKVKPNEICKS